jgi:uncharacterized membrane protein
MSDETDKRAGDAPSGGRPLPNTPPFRGRELAAPPPPEGGRAPSAHADIRRQGEGAASEDSSSAERPLYEALLYPRRSLSERGFLILTIGTAVFGAAYGAMFLVMGAWPIFGYLGAEWLLFWWLLRTHFRGDRRAERIRLYRDRLVLQQIDAKGRTAETRFEPYWLRVVLAERGFENPALLLRSHGTSVEIGTFLGAQERRDFAVELDLVLTGWRTA